MLHIDLSEVFYKVKRSIGNEYLSEYVQSVLFKYFINIRHTSLSVLHCYISGDGIY